MASKLTRGCYRLIAVYLLRLLKQNPNPIIINKTVREFFFDTVLPVARELKRRSQTQQLTATEVKSIVAKAVQNGLNNEYGHFLTFMQKKSESISKRFVQIDATAVYDGTLEYILKAVRQRNMTERHLSGPHLCNYISWKMRKAAITQTSKSLSQQGLTGKSGVWSTARRCDETPVQNHPDPKTKLCDALSETLAFVEFFNADEAKRNSAAESFLTWAAPLLLRRNLKSEDIQVQALIAKMNGQDVHNFAVQHVTEQDVIKFEKRMSRLLESLRLYAKDRYEAGCEEFWTLRLNKYPLSKRAKSKG